MRKIDVGIVALMLMASPLIVHQQGRAETYMGIGYNYTINDVKAMFPGANFEDQKVAWAKPGEKLIAITGEGISGSIRILFQDARPGYSEMYRSFWTGWVAEMNRLRKIANPKPFTLDTKEAEEFAAKQSVDKGFEAKWVRWVPDSPIPFSRLASKFGPKFRYKNGDQDFSINAIWENKGICAPLTDDKKSALWVEYQFTSAEQYHGVERSIKRLNEAIAAARRASDSVETTPETTSVDGETEQRSPNQ